jgi:hypothetical protein
MRQQLQKSINWLGKALLAWFVFESFRFTYYGHILDKIKMLLQLLEADPSFIGLYAILQIPVASICVFVLIPLLLKGHWGGLLLGILYWGMGGLVNPFWYIVPDQYQVTPEKTATPLLLFINGFWATLTLLTELSDLHVGVRQNRLTS